MRTGRAPAERVWDLLAQPSCWPAWAPHMWHVERADGGAAGPVEVGQALRIVSPVPRLGLSLTITAVEDGRSWTMEAELPVLGPVTSRHDLTVDGTDTRVAVTLEWAAHPALAVPVLRAYTPLATLSLDRLLGLAAREADGADMADRRMCRGTHHDHATH